MIKQTFRINGVDYSSHVRDNGVRRLFNPVKGLPDKMTEDNVNHIDFRGYKRTITVSFNPTDEDTTHAIIDAYTSGLQFITIYDTKTKADITFLAEPATAADAPEVVDEGGDITHYQIADLIYKEV